MRKIRGSKNHLNLSDFDITALYLWKDHENDQGDEVAIRMDGSVMDPKTGKIYTGPIEEMEDYAEYQELQNTLREVREFIQGIWNKLED